MCGIVGVVSLTKQPAVDDRLLSRMRDTMQHRGPNGGANWFSPDGRVGFGHRRLSIIDLSTAADQPMVAEGGQVVLTYNGEVYNHNALRRELIAEGQRFTTDHSDTEVVLRGYLQWGIDKLVQKIAGDYAFAIRDARIGKTLLVRDRIGVKPLYFTINARYMIFASEIKAIVSHPAVPRDIEPVAAYHYLSFLATPAPFTMFKDIFKLPAGHYLELSDDGAIRTSRYWDALPGQGIDPKELDGLSAAARADFFTQGVRERLTSAVKKRMMSDVSYGAFLSGGIDSTTNVALMAQFSDQPIHTYTVGFSDHRRLNEVNEASAAAKHFKTDHHEVLIEERDMVGFIDKLIHHQDEPIADWTCVPQYFVAELAHNGGVTVVQVGEGSDEQFCGYESWLEYLKLHRRYWTPFRQFLPHPLQTAAAAMARGATRFAPQYKLYADVIDRAARDREPFWSGAMTFWDLNKRDLIDASSVSPSSVVDTIVDAGLLPLSNLKPDSFNVVKSYFDCIDAAAPGSDILTRMIYSEMKLRLPELLLMRVDKICMAKSLEARVPFLDHELVEFTMDIPMADKLPGGVVKGLLKRAVRGLIPDEVIDRKKAGFAAPMEEWMRSAFGRQVASVLLASKLFDRLPLDRDHVRSLATQHLEGRRNYARFLWTLFNLAAWYDYWIDSSVPG